MIGSPPDGSIDEKVMNDSFGRDGNRPRDYAESDSHPARNAEPPLENNDWHNAHYD